MKWLVRGFVVLVVLLTLAVAGLFAVLATFDPNNYKDKITVAVESATGREFTIAGDIKATLFPVLGFEVTGVRMGNPPSFAEKEFLEVSEAQAGVKIMPLIEKRIELTKVVLSNPSINLIKTSAGQTNMDFSNGKPATVKKEGDAPAMDLSVGSIEVKGAKVTYTDQGTGKTVEIDPLNVTLPGYTPGQETDVAIDMVLKAGESSMKLDATAKAMASPEEGTLALRGLAADVVMSAPTLADTVKVRLSGQGNMNAKTQDMNLDISELKVSWQGTEINGKATIGGKFSEPVTKFAASSSIVNLDELLAGIKKDGKGDPNRPLLPVDMLRNLNMNGDVNIKELVFNGLSIRNVDADINAKNGLVAIAPMTAEFYEGKANASVTIDVRPSKPVFSIKNDVSGVAIGQVLKAKMGESYITGKADVSYDLKTEGNNIKALQQGAGGLVSFKLGEGYINKWQLSRLLNQAIAFFKNGSIGEGADDKIYFTALNATFNGQSGIFRNSDLVMSGPEIHALGSGVVDLVSQKVDYGLKVGLGAEPSAEAKHIPISISGPLSKPSYTLDTKALVQNKVKEKIQEKLLDKLGGGNAAEPAAEGEAAPQEASPEEEAAKQLINGIFGQ